MSLRVWLPLNGDLHNQGLSNITVTNNGATVNNSGKIGSCYSFDGTDDFIKIEGTKLTEIFTGGSQQFSVCMWIYNNETAANRAILFGNYTVSPSTSSAFFNIELMSSSNQIRYDWKANPDWNAGSNTVIPTGTWTHLCCSYDGAQEYVYLNGQLQANRSGILPSMGISSGVVYYLGRDARTGVTAFNGKLNDFRIYDHALSAKEVEEIAKGLVLHYKLDNGGMGNPNLAKNSNTDSTSSNVWTLSMATGGTTKTIITDNGVHCVQITRNDTAQSGWRFMGYNNFDRTAIKTDTYYTASFDIKSNYTGTISFTGLVNSNATNYMTGSDRIVNCNTVYANAWSHISLTIKTISSFDNITVGSQIIYFAPSDGIYTTGNVILLKNIKLEEGKIDTYWIPNKSDALYSLYAANDTTVYDSSGYGNNGTIVGSLETTTPSPKYSCATFFDNQEYIIHKLPENMYQATYSFWIKASSYTGYGAVYMPYQSPSAGTSPWFAINTESCKVWAYFGNNSPHYTKGSGTMPLNEWHHCVYVWDNGVAQWYVDGEKNGNNVTYTGRTFIQNTANATIGNSYTGTSWNGTPFTGEISDFRIYATALTEAQIKELYMTSMSIDKNGNIHVREVVEI